MFEIATDFRRIATAAIGAALFSATCIGAAVGPARAATPVVSAVAWQQTVQNRINSEMRRPAIPASIVNHATASVHVRFDAEGRFAGAKLVRSSGSRAVDLEAMRVANKIKYPALPASLGGTSTVELALYFGQDDDAAVKADKLARQTAAAKDRAFAVRLAEGSAAQMPVG